MHKLTLVTYFVTYVSNSRWFKKLSSFSQNALVIFPHLTLMDNLFLVTVIKLRLFLTLLVAFYSHLKQA